MEPGWNLNGDLNGNLNRNLDGNLNGDLDRNLNGNQPGTELGLNLDHRGSLQAPWGYLGGHWGSLEGPLGHQTGTQDWSGTGLAPGIQRRPKVYNCRQKQAGGQTTRHRALPDFGAP